MRWPWRKKNTPAPDRDGRFVSVVVECEAFLTGRYLELAVGRGGSIPGWVWLNRLAHADAAELVELSERASEAWDGWPRVMTGLAEDVLAYGRHEDAAVRSLQQDVLVPLELRMLADDPARVLRPEQLGDLVTAALRQHTAGCS